jgi:hypothetical protein
MRINGFPTANGFAVETGRFQLLDSMDVPKRPTAEIPEIRRLFVLCNIYRLIYIIQIPIPSIPNPLKV